MRNLLPENCFGSNSELKTWQIFNAAVGVLALRLSSFWLVFSACSVHMLRGLYLWTFEGTQTWVGTWYREPLCKVPLQRVAYPEIAATRAYALQ